MILLDVDSVSMTRPGRPLFSDVSLTVSDGDRLGVVGINGTGKSTLLRVVAGEVEPEEGSVRRGRGLDLEFLAQDPKLRSGTVREAVVHGHEGREWEVTSVADRLGLGPLMDRDADSLSGGQAKRVALARALVGEADLLILDEPTNHLDIDAIAWLEDRLADYRGALILVTHDRHFLDRITTRILELDRGRSYIHEGGYDAYLANRAEREAHAAKAEQTRRNLASRELAWLRRGAPARTSKPKARIEAATAIIESRPEAAARAGLLPLHSSTPRLGDKVIELRGVSHSFGSEDLFTDVDLLLDNRERLGVVGANGTGKSTLLDVMAGRLTPRHGTVERGSTVQIGYYDQLGRALDPTQRVRDAVTGGKGSVDWTDTALMEAFWFDGDAQWAQIGLLSGGERRRLQLLLTLAERPNVLIMDEPTNDLDLDTLRQLEDFLEEWPGALVVVSHDRAFLERVVTDVVVLDGAGTAARKPGGYAAYEAERRSKRGRGKVSATPSSSRPRERSAETSDSARDGGPGLTSKQRSISTVRHQLKQAEKDLKAARDRHERLLSELESEAASAGHEKLAKLGTDIRSAEAAIGDAEERWLDLAAEAESRGVKV